MKKLPALLIASVALNGCGTLDHKTVLIDPGTGKERVLELMGTPGDRQFQGQMEAWQYCKTGAGVGYHDYKIIWFSSGLVTGITSYKQGGPAFCAAGFGPIRWESAPDSTVEIRNR